VQWYVEGFVERSGIKVALDIVKIPRLPSIIELQFSGVAGGAD